MPSNSDLLTALQKLKDAVRELPESTPEGASDGIVGRNFISQRLKDDEDAIWETTDQAYTQCFSKTPGSNLSPEDNVLRGRFGMDLVLGFFGAAAQSSKLRSDEAFLIQLKLNQLNQLTDIVYACIKSLPPDVTPRQTKKTAGKCKKVNASASGRSKGNPSKSIAITGNDSDRDGDYRPPADTPQDSSKIDSYATETASASAVGTKRTDGNPKPKSQQKRPVYILGITRK
ncbi:hypothetical protein FRC07_015155 [Ceratobasidium sp. 392]|nr:hypothetical protein FRC07_015155 [Ceratobasidium sp. 392]